MTFRINGNKTFGKNAQQLLIVYKMLRTFLLQSLIKKITKAKHVVKRWLNGESGVPAE